MVEDQSEALDLVEAILQRLNQTVFEGQDEIEDILTMKIKQQSVQLTALRSLMHNFTGLVNSVIKDKISQVFGERHFKLYFSAFNIFPSFLILIF